MGMIGGIASWIATNFLGHPLTRFYRLKDDVRSALTFFANVSPVYEHDVPRQHPDWERFIEAQSKYRGLASELEALAHNHRLINRGLSRLGYQLVNAASGLIGFSNTLADPAARRRGELASHRDSIERALKFELSHPQGVKVRDE